MSQICITYLVYKIKLGKERQVKVYYSSQALKVIPIWNNYRVYPNSGMDGTAT